MFTIVEQLLELDFGEDRVILLEQRWLRVPGRRVP
jgi:hypothetical protein